MNIITSFSSHTFESGLLKKVSPTYENPVKKQKAVDSNSIEWDAT